MPSTPNCPSRETLEQFLRGETDPTLGESLANHVEDCPRCVEAMRSLDIEDALVRELQQALPAAGSPNSKAGIKTILEAISQRFQSTRSFSPPHPARRGQFNLADLTNDKYEFLGELGHGGFGVVFKARQRSTQQIVAVKMILAGDRAQPKEKALFLNEVESAAALRHPNIVRVYEAGEIHGQPYFSMEYVDGDTLSTLLRDGPLPPIAAASLIERIARAAHFAHEHHTLHRDLKPGNILLDRTPRPDGLLLRDPAQRLEPKINDFGLAKRLDAPDKTQKSAVMGTLRYMAPEQAGGKELGPTVDIYALGVILYELLTGRPPFLGATEMETYQQLLHQEPVPPTKLQPTIARDLETIALKCLQNNPAKRYASSSALAEDLHRYCNGDPILARPIGYAELVWRWAKKRKPLVATVAAAVVLLAASAIGFGIQSRANHAAALVKSLTEAQIGEVKAIVAELDGYRYWADPLLKARFADSDAATSGADADRLARQKLHLAVALAPVDESKIDYLYDRLLDADASQVAVIRDALLPHKESLIDKLWTVAAAPPKKSQRLRAAAALAQFAPENDRWESINTALAADLVAENALVLNAWNEAFRPVRQRLIAPLSELYRDRNSVRASERMLAANILADFASDQTKVLTELLMDADEQQFVRIYPMVDKQRSGCIAELVAELEKKDSTSAHVKVVLEETGIIERLAKRQANAAVALLKLEQPDKVWPLLKHDPDPSVRSYLIHKFAPLDVDVRNLIGRLENERDITIQRALLLSLGEYSEEQLSLKTREEQLPRLKEIYQTAADPGLHAAAEWLLRTWRQESWLNEAIDQWAKDSELRRKRLKDIQAMVAKIKEKTPPQWYVDGQGHSMVLIPGPVEFAMGSPLSELTRDISEPQHARRINRTFAIAAKAVTMAQFQKYQKGNRLFDPNLPVGATSWFQAAGYCNWLSEKEGIAEKEWCYLTEPAGKTGPNVRVVRLRANYLSLKGYRLPTEAEMEYATGAGAITSRFFGECDDLLGKYAWYFNNSEDKSRPGAMLKPNDLGLFDVQGNAFTWCQEEYKAYPSGPNVDDMEDGLAISDRFRVLRGGSSSTRAKYVRTSIRYNHGPKSNSGNIGFRVARTLPLDASTALETITP